MFCPECGARNEEGARFCEGCGKDLKGIGMAKPPVKMASTIPDAMPTEIRRPMPIILITIYFVFWGVLGALIFGIAELIIASLPKELDAAFSFASQVGLSLFTAALMVEIGVIFSLLSLAAAYGIWKFTQWGRYTAIILAGFGFLFSIVNLFQTNTGGILITVELSRKSGR